jgi:hypothetical protein
MASHIKKPKHQKTTPLSATIADVPLKMHQEEIPSDMGRTRTGIQHSAEVWGDRAFGSDRKHPKAKPSC